LKFFVKWLINGVIVVTMLMYYADVSFINAAITATVLTIIAYVIGDQLILRASNNMVATISDAVLAFVFFWVAAVIMNWRLDLTEIFFIALMLGVAEWILHRYLFGINVTAT